MRTRKTLIIMLVAALLVVYYILGTGYLKQRRQNEALASQLVDTLQATAQMPAPPADLELQLAAANATLETAKDLFPGMMSSTRIVNTILRLADEGEVKAIPLVTQPWTTEAVNDYSYSVFRLNVAVTGTFARLVSFMNQLEKGEIQTLIIEHTHVTATEESEAGISTEGIPVHASLDLAIYTQPPPSEQQRSTVTE